MRKAIFDKEKQRMYLLSMVILQHIEFTVNIYDQLILFITEFPRVKHFGTASVVLASISTSFHARSNVHSDSLLNTMKTYGSL